MARNPNCTKCILHESSVNVCIFGKGDAKQGFAIGEAPGKNEARTGEAFTGEAGRLLRPILADYGMENPYITNVAKCRPPDNRKPEPSEIAACKPYLLEEIETEKPKAILLLGAVAMKAMIGKAGITEMNGQVVQGKDGRTYVCAFHPAYILRDPSKEGQLRMAIKRYADVLNDAPPPAEPIVRFIEKSTIDEFIDDWIRSTEMTFDCESAGENAGEGLEWWKDGFDLTSIAFSLLVDGEEKNWSLALPGHPSANITEEFAKELLTELSRSTAGKKVTNQNVKFDNIVLMKRYGVRFHTTGDSMLAHHVVDENSNHGLKSLAREHLGAPDYDLSRKEKLNTRLVPIRRLLTYGGRDTAYARRLEPIFYGMMDEDERLLYDRVIMPASRAFELSDYNGLYVDIDYLNRASDEEYDKLKKAEKELNKLLGRSINWNSPIQVREALFGDLGLTPTVFTDKVNPETGERDIPSTGEEALVDIDHPIAKAVETYRGHHKFLSTYTGYPPGTPENDQETYVGGWREFMYGPHLYLSTKLHGTVTGRYSNRLHQTPRDGTIRNAIIAPPGWKFVQLDVAQAELRVIAIISRDPTMLQIFREGKDIHWYTLMDAVHSGGGEYVDLVWKTVRQMTKRKLTFAEAIELLRNTHHDEVIELEKAWKEGRKKAKGINFGFAYGQSAAGFITYAKTKYGFEPTMDESSTFRNSFFNTYSRLPDWHDRQKKIVKLDGFVRSLSGRKRRLPGIYSKDKSVRAECERQAINSPVQGFIGDYKAMIYVELDQSIPKTHLRLVGEVHDSILMWVKEGHENSVLRTVKAIAENPRIAREFGLKFPIPITVDIEVGPWGAGKKWSG